MKVLNVGGGTKDIPLPPSYEGVEHVLLDIAPGPDVDIVADTRLYDFQPEYDVVYCSHNLEHYYAHETVPVLQQFRRALVPCGIVHIKVPDIAALILLVAENSLDLEDVLYYSPAGPIQVQDVIYGYGVEIEQSGQPFYAHKTGFSANKLSRKLNDAGFKEVTVIEQNDSLELEAFGMNL